MIAFLFLNIYQNQAEQWQLWWNLGMNLSSKEIFFKTTEITISRTYVLTVWHVKVMMTPAKNHQHTFRAHMVWQKSLAEECRIINKIMSSNPNMLWSPCSGLDHAQRNYTEIISLQNKSTLTSSFVDEK